MGDIIFIKSFVPTAGLHIKAVGVVTDGTFRKITDKLGWGVGARWVPLPDGRIVIGPVEDHSDYMQLGTLRDHSDQNEWHGWHTPAFSDQVV
jgi:hypothetical protein